MPMKLLRTLRLDASDAQVFPRAAAAGEWAVTGTFAFVDHAPESLAGKERVAFRSGWLGIESFGRATFVQVATISPEELQGVTARLADRLEFEFGAPSRAAAEEAAAEEIAHAQSLAEHAPGTLLALEREWAEDGIAERIRVIDPKGGDERHAPIWALLPDGES